MTEYLGRIRFTDGVKWSVSRDGEGRQYVLDDEGNRVHGVWRIREEELDLPVIVDGARP